MLHKTAAPRFQPNSMPDWSKHAMPFQGPDKHSMPSQSSDMTFMESTLSMDMSAPQAHHSNPRTHHNHHLDGNNNIYPHVNASKGMDMQQQLEVDCQQPIYQNFPGALAYLDQLVNVPPNAPYGSHALGAPLARDHMSAYKHGAYDQALIQQNQFMWMYNCGPKLSFMSPDFKSHMTMTYNTPLDQKGMNMSQVESKLEKRRRQNRESQQRFRDKRRREKLDTSSAKKGSKTSPTSDQSSSISKGDDKRKRERTAHTRRRDMLVMRDIFVECT